MTPNSAPRAIVAGHGSFAAGIISAVEQITGMGSVFVAVSNADLSPGGIEAKVRASLAETGARVIFTDLPAGSCTMAVRRMARLEPGLTLVTGVTLPTLLAFALGADAREAVEKGREAITILEDGRGA
jgi:PTS system N-acetylgalactosamine-specific IIA component